MQSKELLLSATKNNQEAKTFVEGVILFCEQNNITLNVSPETFVLMGNSKVNGYFLASNIELGIAVGKDISLWLPILLHERCHAQQFIDDPKWFTELDKNSEEFFSWIENKALELPQKTLFDYMMAALMIESDCEIRSEQSIKEFQLYNLVDIITYAQKANAYITFYRFIAEERVWYRVGCEPYTLEEIWSKFPKTVNLMGCQLTDEYRELFKKCI